ncbi:hypothetical protein J3E69DRAFT_128770 [Trichoderma sp. SZMC 28015]
MGSVPGCLFASAWRWLREGLLVDLAFLSCVLRLASCLFGWLSRAYQNLSLSLVLAGVVAISISFLATRLVSSLTLPLFFFVFPSPCPPTVGLVSEQLFSLAFCLLSKCTPACHPLRLPCIIHWGHFAGIAGWGVLSIGRCEWVLLEVGATPWLETQRFFLCFFSLLLPWSHTGDSYRLQGAWGTALQAGHPIRRRLGTPYMERTTATSLGARNLRVEVQTRVRQRERTGSTWAGEIGSRYLGRTPTSADREGSIIQVLFKLDGLDGMSHAGCGSEGGCGCG